MSGDCLSLAVVFSATGVATGVGTTSSPAWSSVAMHRVASVRRASTRRAVLVVGLVCSQAALRGDGGLHGESLSATVDGDDAVPSDSGVGTSLQPLRKQVVGTR